MFPADSHANVQVFALGKLKNVNEDYGELSLIARHGCCSCSKLDKVHPSCREYGADEGYLQQATGGEWSNLYPKSGASDQMELSSAFHKLFLSFSHVVMG